MRGKRKTGDGTPTTPGATDKKPPAKAGG